jgi:hypothetical protein
MATYYPRRATFLDPRLRVIAFSTQCAYQSNLRSWIIPAWGNHQLGEVKAVQVEAWLMSLSLKNGSKNKIRNILCSFFSHACPMGDHRPQPDCAFTAEDAEGEASAVLTKR